MTERPIESESQLQLTNDNMVKVCSLAAVSKDTAMLGEMPVNKHRVLAHTHTHVKYTARARTIQLLQHTAQRIITP